MSCNFIHLQLAMHRSVCCNIKIDHDIMLPKIVLMFVPHINMDSTVSYYHNFGNTPSLQFELCSLCCSQWIRKAWGYYVTASNMRKKIRTKTSTIYLFNYMSGHVNVVGKVQRCSKFHLNIKQISIQDNGKWKFLKWYG